MNNVKLQRIEALDVFRAITMFLMLFVNDISGLDEIPYWLLHAKPDEDMLGFSDTIFPGFLFAMGMAIPFAIENRFRKGDSFFQVIEHIFWRTVALLVMGLYTVNRDTMDPEATGILQPWFSICMVFAFFLIWGVYPKASDIKKYIFQGMKLIGIALLLFLFYRYKGADGAAFSPQWWGILGLIGWTYLLCAAVYLVVRTNLALNLTVFGLILSCSILSEAGLFQHFFLAQWLPSEATLYAFGMAGVCASLLMQKYANPQHPNRFIVLFLQIGIGMLIAGVVSNNFWIISKQQATPTWFFYCCSLFFPLFAMVYMLTDVLGKTHWFAWIKPAGTVTLTCYIIPYVWYSVQSLLQFSYPDVLSTGITGLLRSLVYSFAILAVAWGLMKIKVRLKV